MVRSPALRSLVRSLDRLDRYDCETLSRALREAPDLRAIASHARFEHDRYQRVPLHRTSEYEIRLLCWLPGQSSALHTHGSSSCVFTVLEGAATESRLEAPDRRLLPGALAESVPGSVHQVANIDDLPLVTLHVYARPLPVDLPTSPLGKRIVIIGGGFSGTALAIHLLRARDPELRITIVERAERQMARGVAYRTEAPEHLLNVPAGRMSLDPSRPEDFHTYAVGRGEPSGLDRFFPRSLYGDYVSERFEQAITSCPGRVRLARQHAVGLRPSGDGWRVLLSDGRALDADHVVLATGHGGQRVPEGLVAIRHDPRVVLDPLAHGAIDRIPLHERLLVVGTGLSAVDTLTSLRARGHRGEIIAVSRSGRWPCAHLPSPLWTGEPYQLTGASPRTADGLAAWLRGHIDAAKSRGIPWQVVADAARTRTPEIWGRLPHHERARFLIGHASRWSRLRHRLPVEAAERLRDWQAEGWLQVLQGTIQARADRYRFEISVGHTPAPVDRVLLCTGPESDPRRFVGPLWRDLIASGHVIADSLGLGILTRDDHSAVPHLPRARNLWAIGGLQRPRLFESSAAPEITASAIELAKTLVSLEVPPLRLAADVPHDRWA